MARKTRQEQGLSDRRKTTPRDSKGRIIPFVPTEKQREFVALEAAYGKSLEWICNHLPGAKGQLCEQTLKTHFQKEIDEGVDYANAQLGGVLFAQARAGNVRALEQWFDRRGGTTWKRKVTQEHSGPDGGPIRYSDLSDEELEAKLNELRQASNGNDSSNA
jgi:hypothetical protein